MTTYRDKGGIPLETFCVVFTNAVSDMRIYDDIELRDIAIFANNVTISFLQTIIENPAFFERKVGIKKQKRLRIIKDLESLKYIEYTDVENYLSKIAVMLPDDNCILIDEFEKVKDFQDEYIGTKSGKLTPSTYGSYFGFVS